MRVVVDTNVFFSALRTAVNPRSHSNPGTLLLRAGFGDFTLLTTEAILSELEEVLSRKLHWDKMHLNSTIDRIRSISEVIDPKSSISECADPDDDRILEAAVDGRADCIVTGDADLLCMNPFRGIQVCTTLDFLLRLDDPSIRL